MFGIINSNLKVRDIKEKIKSIFLVIVNAIIILFLFVQSFGESTIRPFEYVVCQASKSSTDCPLYPIITSPKPAKGVSITDPNFHTQISRVSDKVIDRYVPDSRYGMTLYYSTFTPENADGTYVLLNDHALKGWVLYNANSLALAKLLTALPEIEEAPRWDAKDPNIFYYVSHMRAYSYDVRTDASKLIHDFSKEYPESTNVKINWSFEGEPSVDGRYWAMVITGHKGGDWWAEAILCYDKQTNAVLGNIRRNDIPSGWGVDWVSMSPSGAYVVVRYSYTRGAANIYAYTRDFSNSHLVTSSRAQHSDRGKDINGNDVIVYFSDNGYVCMADIGLGTPNETKLFSYSVAWGSPPSIGGGHISANNTDKPGWAVISVECDHTDAINWPDNSIFMVELKANARIWRIAHDHDPATVYWTTPFAAINKAGTRIYFGSNWDTKDATQMDVYRVDLPETWWIDLNLKFRNKK